MIVSRETLILESNKNGFRAEILEKVIRLIDLLNAFAQDEFLKSRIALKGGTALNLFHFDLPRLSVDIDLNYIGSLDRDTMLSEKPKMLSTIEQICLDKKYYNIRQPSEHAGGKWTFGYKSELIQQGQLEIDLNFISRASLWPLCYLDSSKIGHYQAKSIPVLDYYDLIGGKLSALFSRHKSRDLYDAYIIFTNSKKLDKTKIKFAFMIYGAAARMDIRKTSLDHINFNVNELKNMLLPVLRGEELKNTKNIRTWSNNLINTCKENLAEIITFNNNELEFLTNIIEHGKIIPELITNDKTLINVINQHPVLLWKCIHVREYMKDDISE
jgi:predicted nucleotidyltransferase component of viral defense system